jgi:hypothetical protein
MLASTLEGEVGDTIDATVMLLEAGDTRGPSVFVAIGEGVFSVPDDWYPEDGGVKRCELFIETIEVSARRVSPTCRVAKELRQSDMSGLHLRLLVSPLLEHEKYAESRFSSVGLRTSAIPTGVWEVGE